MDKLQDEIRELKSAVQERNETVLQTLDASSQVARAMEELVARTQVKNRFQQLNSFVAYLLFTVLLGGGFYGLYSSRSGALNSAREQAILSANEARAQAQSLQDSQVIRKQSAQAAFEYYTLIREGRHSEVIAGYEGLSDLSLSETERAAFDDGVKSSKAKLVEAGYIAGVEAFRKDNFESATAELRKGLTYAQPGDKTAQMRYYLGISLARRGAQEEAIKQLQLAIAGSVEQAGIDDARFHLANTMVQHGLLEEAKKEFNRFANKHPRHRFAQMARRKAAQILRADRERERMARNSPKPVVPQTTAPKPFVKPVVRAQ